MIFFPEILHARVKLETIICSFERQNFCFLSRCRNQDFLAPAFVSSHFINRYFLYKATMQWMRDVMRCYAGSRVQQKPHRIEARTLQTSSFGVSLTEPKGFWSVVVMLSRRHNRRVDGEALTTCTHHLRCGCWCLLQTRSAGFAESCLTFSSRIANRTCHLFV